MTHATQNTGDETMKTQNETTTVATDDLDYDLVRTAVMSYMHYDGDDRWRLNDGQWVAIYLHGNGFGEINRGFAQEQCWDWSHVRDSNQAGIRKMWEHICWLHNNARLNVAK